MNTHFIKTISFLVFVTLMGPSVAFCDTQDTSPARQVESARPNILILMAEDMSARVGAFGDSVAVTPGLDKLAESGVRFPNTFTTAGVCAPSRAAHITGMHQISMGGQHMRTRSFKPTPYRAVPPPEVKAYTIEKPARLAIDFGNTSSALERKRFSLPYGNATGVLVLESGERTRMVVNLVKLVPYETRVEGNIVVVTLGTAASTAETAAPVLATSESVKPGSPSEAARTVEAVTNTP